MDVANALHSAAVGESLELVRYLIEEKGFNPSSLDANHQTPLHLASISGHLALTSH